MRHQPPTNISELREELTAPTEASLAAVRNLNGDLLILGAGGKMGPSLALLAQRSIQAANLPYRVHCVSRFSAPDAAAELTEHGILVTSRDLLESNALSALPDTPNVIFMAGMKFGSTGAEPLTWMLNTFLPGLVARRFAQSRFVALSTGNVYPFTPVSGGGATEQTAPEPRGEYAQSCLGRERVFEYAAQQYGTPVAIIRLNYANDLRYGVLHDIAQRVLNEQPVDVSMGSVNVLWQGDANRMILQSFSQCANPACFINLAGPETVSVRWIAQRFGELYRSEPIITGAENTTALLSNSALSMRLFGYPHITLDEMIEWTAAWVKQGGVSLYKPTHFETRNGRF